MILDGTAYHIRGSAYHPRTGELCKINFYGGYVCSQGCDYRSSLELEQSMPGHGVQQKTIGCIAREHYDQNWHYKEE